MYKEHFGFKFSPFSIAPDPHYLYMSDQHREALAHLLYGMKSDGGFVLLTGEVGTGKTTVCRCLMEQLPEKTDIAMVLNPKLNAQELLATICEEFGIETGGGNLSVKYLIDYLNHFLLDAHAQGRHCILIIDEAQNLSAEVLEQLRLLTNLETNERKLLQIIMIGQPELKELLERLELRQLAQRVTARYHLNPLSRKEVSAYISHRLSVAGYPGHLSRQLFPPPILNTIYDLAKGIPRLINVICDRSLLGAYVQGTDRVDKATVKQAAKEIFGRKDERRPLLFAGTPAWVFAGLALILCFSLAALYYFNFNATVAGLKAQEAATVPEADNAVPVPEKIDQLPPAAPPETVPAVEAAAPPATVALEWPKNLPLSRSKTLAYEALFKAWGTPFSPVRNNAPCNSVPEDRFRCLHLKSSLDSLLYLNRPAVLTLHSDAGEEYYATLLSVEGETATFAIGDESLVVQRSEIWPHWDGDYIMLWAPPPGYQDSIRPGDKGPAVEWLSQRLMAIDREAAEKGAPPVYKDTLVDRVRKFQFAMHLVPDGVVGPQTIIHLESASGAQVPKLIKRP